MAEERNREPGFAAPDLVVTRTKGDPFRELPDRLGMLGGAEPSTRAATALDTFAKEIPDPGAQLVGKMLEYDPTSSTAEFVLATADPAYRSAFIKWLRDPVDGRTTWTHEEGLAYQRTDSVRAALSLTPANGGYLVPFTLDPTIILTNAGSAYPYRSVATIKTTSTNDWNGVTSAGVNAEWTAEGVEAADASPTVGQLKITPQKADAYVFGSYRCSPTQTSPHSCPSCSATRRTDWKRPRSPSEPVPASRRGSWSPAPPTRRPAPPPDPESPTSTACRTSSRPAGVARVPGRSGSPR